MVERLQLHIYTQTAIIVQINSTISMNLQLTNSGSGQILDNYYSTHIN